MSESDKITKPQLAEDEIDLIALARTIWNGRMTVIIITIIFSILGLFIAIVAPKQYTVNTIMVPQLSGQENNLGGLSSLAAMAGFNIDNMNSGSELSALIYPQIVQSIPFQLELMKTKLNFEGYDEKISLYDFYSDPKYAKFNLISSIKKYTVGLPGIIIKAIRGKKKKSVYSDEESNRIIQLSEKEKNISKLLSSWVYLDVNQKDGYITLTSVMPEARAAAQLAQKAQSLLQEKIIEFKIEKAKSQLEFVQERYNEKEKEFNKIQEKLARSKDKNKNIITEIGKTELERYQGEYLIISSVFSELSKQLENSKIQVKKETPVFSIIKPVIVPNEKSKPNRPMILIIWTFLGGIIGIGWIFGKQFLQTIKTKWNEEPGKQA
jgi:hypothetical protein